MIKNIQKTFFSILLSILMIGCSGGTPPEVSSELVNADVRIQGDSPVHYLVNEMAVPMVKVKYSVEGLIPLGTSLRKINDKVYLTFPDMRFFQLSQANGIRIAWSEVPSSSQNKSMIHAPVSPDVSWTINKNELNYKDAAVGQSGLSAKVNIKFDVVESKQVLSSSLLDICMVSPGGDQIECVSKLGDALISRGLVLPSSTPRPLGATFLSYRGSDVLLVVFKDKILEYTFDGKINEGVEKTTLNVISYPGFTSDITAVFFVTDFAQEANNLQFAALGMDGVFYFQKSFFEAGILSANFEVSDWSSTPLNSIKANVEVDNVADSEKDSSSQAPDEKDEPIDFETKILPLATLHCAQCHNANSAQGGFPFDAVKEETWEQLAGQISQSIEQERMPPSQESFSLEDKNLILKWIEGL